MQESILKQSKNTNGKNREGSKQLGAEVEETEYVDNRHSRDRRRKRSRKSNNQTNVRRKAAEVKKDLSLQVESQD